MRGILFRGKRIDDGEWETGSLIRVRVGCSDEHTFIADKMTGYHTGVIAQTVGQYTGLTDKNGVKIFEGDRIDHFATQGTVLFEDGMFSLDKSPKIQFKKYRQPLCYIDVEFCEVIGNIHDIPELPQVKRGQAMRESRLMQDGIEYRKYHCSHCSWMWLEDCDASDYPNYCPHCGVEMNKEADRETD